MTQNSRNVKVLLVDDDNCLRSIMRMNLECLGFIVEEADNGVSGLKQVSDFKPDVIIMDGVMPVMNGVQACKYLKADPKTKDIPIIFCSAIPFAEIDSDQVQVQGKVQKPFTCQELTGLIAKVLFLRFDNRFP